MIPLEKLSLLKITSQIHPVSEALQKDLIQTLAIESIPKKTYLLKEGEVFQKMYFIEKGMARAFYFDEGKEHTSWFMKEGDFIISVNSFYKQVPSQENIEVLEDSIMASISYHQLQELYQKHLEFNIISRVLTEHYYSLSEERLFAMRQSSAKHRFDFFINHYPELAKRISLKQMASFLRMTPETISREQEVSPDKSIEKVLAQEDPKLAHGLSLIQSRASKNGRVEKSQIDELLLDSALRKFDKNTGSTNYSLLLYKNLPYSIGNLVVAEKNGNYLAFTVEYINANPKSGWDLAKFQGKMILTSIDGGRKKTVDINPEQSKNGRTDASICSTTVTKVTVSSVYGSYTYYETEFGCVFIDFDNFGDVGSGSYESQTGDTPISDSGNGVSSEPTYIVEAPTDDKKISNRKDYLKCFDVTKPAKLTIYADQPVPNTRLAYAPPRNVGHSFISIEQNVNGATN